MSYVDKNAHLFDLLQMLLDDSCADPLCKIKFKYIYRLYHEINREIGQQILEFGEEAVREKSLIADALLVFVPRTPVERWFHKLLVEKVSPIDDNNDETTPEEVDKENRTTMTFIESIMANINACMTIGDKEEIEKNGFTVNEFLTPRIKTDTYNVVLTTPKGTIKLIMNGKPYSNVYPVDKMPTQTYGTKRGLRARAKKMDPESSKI